MFITLYQDVIKRSVIYAYLAFVFSSKEFYFLFDELALIMKYVFNKKFARNMIQMLQWSIFWPFEEEYFLKLHYLFHIFIKIFWVWKLTKTNLFSIWWKWSYIEQFILFFYHFIFFSISLFIFLFFFFAFLDTSIHSSSWLIWVLYFCSFDMAIISTTSRLKIFPVMWMKWSEKNFRNWESQ